MKSFREYVTEAKNMWADLAKPPVGPQLFHKDIGIPQQLERPQAGMRLNYGKHAKDEVSNDRQHPGVSASRLPDTLPSALTVIEVESMKGRATKWVVRFPFEDAGWDLVMAVTVDGFVKTVWFNKSDDLHGTLDRSKYLSPKKFSRN